MTRALDPDTEIDEITASRKGGFSGRWQRVKKGTTPWTPAEAASFGQPLEGGKKRKLGTRILVGTVRGTWRGVIKAGSASGRIVANRWRTYRQRVRFDKGYNADRGEVPAKLLRPRRTGANWFTFTLGRPKHRCITCGRAYDCPTAFSKHARQHLVAELPEATGGNAWAHLAEKGFTGEAPVPSWGDSLRIKVRSRKFRQEIGQASKGQTPKLVLVKGRKQSSHPAAVPVNNTRGAGSMFESWTHTPFTGTLQQAAAHLMEQPLRMSLINATGRGTEYTSGLLAEAYRSAHLKAVRAGFDLASIEWLRQLAALEEQKAQVASRGLALMFEEYGKDIQMAVAQAQGRKPSAEVLAS